MATSTIKQSMANSLVNDERTKTIAGIWCSDSATAFTLNVKTLVIGQITVNSAWPRGIAFTKTLSDSLTLEDLYGVNTADSNIRAITTVAILGAGTYYIAAKGVVSDSSGCIVNVYSIPI